MYWLGWEMGAVEAISLSILVGSSVDYCLHLVEGYLLAMESLPADCTLVRRSVYLFCYCVPTCLHLCKKSCLCLWFCSTGGFAEETEAGSGGCKPRGRCHRV